MTICNYPACLDQAAWTVVELIPDEDDALSLNVCTAHRQLDPRHVWNPARDHGWRAIGATDPTLVWYEGVRT